MRALRLYLINPAMNRTRCPHCGIKMGDFLYAHACPNCREELTHNKARVEVDRKDHTPQKQLWPVRLLNRVLRFIES